MSRQPREAIPISIGLTAVTRHSPVAEAGLKWSPSLLLLIHNILTRATRLLQVAKLTSKRLSNSENTVCFSLKQMTQEVS